MKLIREIINLKGPNEYQLWPGDPKSGHQMWTKDRPNSPMMFEFSQSSFHLMISVLKYKI